MYHSHLFSQLIDKTIKTKIRALKYIIKEGCLYNVKSDNMYVKHISENIWYIKVITKKKVCNQA
jgi:hypothetical protein